MPTLSEWDSWLEQSSAKLAPFEVPAEEREQVIAEGEVGQYPGDDPDQFLKSGRKEFTQRKTDRLALTEQVKKARSKEKELHPYPKLERAFAAVTGSVPSFLSPDVDLPQSGMTPDTVYQPPAQTPAQPPPKQTSAKPLPQPKVPGSRFRVEHGHIVDNKRREIVSRDQFEMLANPQEKAEIERQLQPPGQIEVPHEAATVPLSPRQKPVPSSSVTPQIRPTLNRFGSSMEFATPETVALPPPAPPKARSFSEALTLATNNFFQGAAGIPASALKSIAIASKDVDRLLPDMLKDPRKVEDRFTYKLGKAVEDIARKAFPSDPASQQDFMIGVLPQALGSMTAFMAGGLVGAASKAPVVTGGVIAATMGAGTEGAQQYEAAKSFGADDPTRQKAFWLGTAVGSSEALPIAGILNRYNKATGGVFFRVLKEAGVTAAQEYIQEWSQQVGSNAIAQSLYDEHRSIFDNAGISGAGGGASGAIVGVLSGLLQGRRLRKMERAKESTSESPFAGEPTLRQTPLTMPQSAQQPVQPIPQPVQQAPVPHTIVAQIPTELNIAQRPPFLIKQQPQVVPQPITPDAIMQAPIEQAPVTMTPEMMPQAEPVEPMPLPPAPPLEPLPSPTAQPERTLAPTPEAAPSVEDIHEISEAKGIPYDNNRDFMDLTEAVTGERHLDNLTGPERADMVQAIEAQSAQPRPYVPGDPIDADMREALEAPIDEQAHEAAASPLNDRPEPTEAQREAGNFKLGHARIAGLDISIENPEGSIRSGTNKHGKPWQQELKSHYGYIRSFSKDGESISPKGADKDHIDLFIKPGTTSTYDGPVYVVDQVDPDTGKFDETKVLIGYPNKAAARQGYLSNYPDGWNGLGNISLSHIGELKQWLGGKKTKKSFSDQPSKQWVKPETPPTPDLIAKNEAQDVPTPDTVRDAKKPKPAPVASPVGSTPDTVTNPMVQQPRSTLPIEDSMEMQLRAEKAQADLEIAGKETGRRKVMNFDTQGQGGTPEVIGLRSAAPDWYTELTTGPRPLKRAQIDTAIQKIIKNHGVDVGVAVERVKEALLRDREFNRTPWGEDADAIARGEWPSWIEKPAQTETPPTPDLVLTANPPKVSAQKTKNTQKTEQMSIDVPPSLIGGNPIIGREAQPEEAPLFSKNAQAKDAEQVEIPTNEFGTTRDDLSPNDKVEWKSPFTGNVTEASYRGDSNGKAILWTGRTQVTADYADIRKAPTQEKDAEQTTLPATPDAVPVKPEPKPSIGETPDTAPHQKVVAQASTPDALPVVKATAAKQPRTTRKAPAPVPHEVATADTEQAHTPDQITAVGQFTTEQHKAFMRPERKLSPAHESVIRRYAIPEDADRPIFSSTDHDEVKAHPEYSAGKSGNFKSAIRLVRDLVKPEQLQEATRRFKGAVFVAPTAQEASGRNAIPAALASLYADASQGTFDASILQINKPGHTGADPMQRIIARAKFEGQIVKGQRYVLVDDNVTLGGTLAELANYIQSNGGEVAGIAVLTNANRSDTLRPRRQHVRQIEERFGHVLREEFGLDPQSLTAPEADYLVGLRDADALRTRAIKANRERVRRLSGKGISRAKDSPVDPLASDSDPAITELSAPDRDAKSAPRGTESAKELADIFKQESAKSKNAVRPTQPRIPIDPITGGAAAPIGQIILDLEKGTGKKLTVGKTKRGTAGMYQPGSSATIVKYSGDLDTTAHEMSHALDDQYGLVKEWKGQDTSPFDAELSPFAQHSTPSGASPTLTRAEGVAEYMRAWLVNPDTAEAAAPQFTAHVKAKLPADIQKALAAFSAQVRQWHGNTAHAKIMANVQWDTPETGLTQWLAGSRTAKGPGFNLTFGDQMATTWIDRLAPFMKALKYAQDQRGMSAEQTLPGNDPALLSRLFMGVNAKLDDIFAHGMVDSQLERATPGGLSWLMEPLDQTSSKALEADMQEVASFMIAQRTIEKAEQLGKKRVSGIGAGIEDDVSVAESRLAELRKDEGRFAKLKEAASRYRQWADANLRYLVDKGRLSQEQYESIKANNEQYVAMQRILEVSPGEELASFMPKGSPSRKLGAVGTPVQTFEGSTRTIKNPYLSLMDATHRSIREADRNEIMKLFRDLLTVDRRLYDGEPNNLASVGREAQTGELQTIPIFVNGKKEIWQFHPDIYKALKGLDEGTYKLPPFLTILPRILRATIVNTPAFALRNVIRDAWQRSIASLSGSKPWDTLKVYSKEEISQLKKSGGDQAGHYYTDSKNYARAMKFAIQEAVASHNSVVVDPSKLWTWTKQSGQSYLDLMQGSERQGRLSEYRRAFRKAQKKLGYDDYHAMLYAASQSRSLIDYAIAGNTMAIINQLIPFSNAAVQGLRSNILRAKADPAGFALRFGVFALVPTLMNYAWNYLYDGDDLDEYRQLPAYQRDLFWNFKLGPDLWLKVPKPFELGVMASSFERMLDYSTGNEKAFDGHVGAFLRTLLPVDDASLAGPYQSWFQAATNYDFFRDRPIVPRWEENLALDLRNYHRASRLGQALQQAVGVDARKIDFLLQSQFGYVGRYAVDLSDTGRKDKHGLTLSASGVTGGSPASVSLDAKAVSKIAEERGVVPSRSKAVDRITNMAQITERNAKHPDSLRYAVFRKHLNEYYKSESREDRDRLAKQVRDDAKYLRDLWEKKPPRPEADDKIKKKRAIESEYDPFLELMGFPQPISKHPTTSLHELVP